MPVMRTRVRICDVCKTYVPRFLSGERARIEALAVSWYARHFFSFHVLRPDNSRRSSVESSRHEQAALQNARGKPSARASALAHIIALCSRLRHLPAGQVHEEVHSLQAQLHRKAWLWERTQGSVQASQMM